MGRPRPPAPGLHLSSQSHLAISGFLLGPAEVTSCGHPFGPAPVATPPCPRDWSQHWVQSGLCVTTESWPLPHLSLRPRRPTVSIQSCKARQGGGEPPILVLLLTEVLRLSLGLCWRDNTIWLFPALLVSHSGPSVLPPSLLGLLPSFPNFINVISTVLIILMVLCS